VTQVIQIGLPESREQYIHRLGRTARAGKEGDGLLVLFPFEFQFLSELRGLDVPNNNELSSLLDQSSVTEMPEWMEQNFSRVNSGGNKLASSAQLAYLAFLGYYLGQMSRIRIRSKEEVVRLSNDFSDSIGLAHVPALPQKLITKMDLVGVPGVRSEDDSQ
jgi:ATP-dependent RNA helicase MSS116